jgi:uncharacterized protein YjiS (DUF1127 family)
MAGVGLVAVARLIPRHFAQALHFARTPGEGLLAECHMTTSPGSAAALEHPMPNITWFLAHSSREGRPAFPLRVQRLPDHAAFDFRSLAGRRNRLAVVPRLYRAFKEWREHRRTLRALAQLDDRVLRDIGVMRGDTRPWWFTDKSRHALKLLDDSELIHLSDFGRDRRRKARHGGSDERYW